MITIDITNANDLATKEKGWLPVLVGRVVGVDIRRKVEEEVAKQLKAELSKQGVEADITVS